MPSSLVHNAPAFEQNSLPKVYTVSEITFNIQTILEAAFDTIWIEGEISNYRLAASGHVYFILKDETAQIRCVLFRHKKGKLKFDPTEGDHVLLFGRITVYNLRGEYQVMVETLEPRGLGALQKAFEQLKEKLSKEGLFNEASKKTLPPFPWKIGIVTSPTSAAIRDLIHVITRRNPKVSILLYPVRVQGDGSAKEIAQAIKDINQKKDLDLLIVGRGGGSTEDLWAFNEECVARALHASQIPVISAVGHEIDFTISDFVADVRAPTPSAAAEIAVPVLTDTTDRLRQLTSNLITTMEKIIQASQGRLSQFIGRRFFRDHLQIIQAPTQRLDELFQRLGRAPAQVLALKRELLKGAWKNLIHASAVGNLPHLKKWLFNLDHRLSRFREQGFKIKLEKLKGIIRSLLQFSIPKNFSHFKELRSVLETTLNRQISFILMTKKERLQSLMKNLHALSPLNILERGYSITTYQGQAVKTHRKVKSGDRVQIQLHDGKLGCRVDETLE